MLELSLVPIKTTGPDKVDVYTRNGPKKRNKYKYTQTHSETKVHKASHVWWHSIVHLFFHSASVIFRTEGLIQMNKHELILSLTLWW